MLEYERADESDGCHCVCRLQQGCGMSKSPFYIFINMVRGVEEMHETYFPQNYFMPGTHH